MILAWSDEAIIRLRSIRDFIAVDNPSAAKRVAARLFPAAESLARFPFSGRQVHGRRRELVVHGTPYLILYEVADELVQNITVLHGAQQR